jgi:hypothetical protein
MRNYFLLCLLILIGSNSFSQNKHIKLSNGLIVAQLDRPEEKFSLEINLAELFSNEGIQVIPSLNILKQGQNPSVLASDSINRLLKSKNVDTYILVSIRGFDKNFKPSSHFESLANELGSSHLFPLFRDEIMSVTFEFTFYRNGQVIANELLRLKNVDSKDKVLKKLRKKLPKLISKWKL